METLGYALVSFVALLGFPAGYVVGWIAKEELRQGKKYFLILNWLLLIAVAVSAVYFIESSFQDSLFLLLAALVFLLGFPCGSLLRLRKL